MALLDRIRKQDAVFWPSEGVDSFGNPTYGDAQDIKVRWEDVHEEFINEEGARTISNAIVFVGIEMEPGDLLRKGTVAELEPGIPANEQTGAFSIEKFESIPDLRAKKFLRRAIL